MRYMEIGRSGLKASVVAIGAYGLGGGKSWSDTNADAGTTTSILDAALDVGVNLIDTAPVYGLGTSETFLGEALKGRRDKFILQTKCGMNWRDKEGHLEYERDGIYVYRNLTADAIRRDLEGSLLRMKTDYIDILITHRQSETTPIEETMGTLLELQKEGKIRAVGISNASPEILKAYHQYGPVALVQEKFSILTPAAREEYIPACEAEGTAFQVYGSLEGGALTGPQLLGKTYPKGDYRGNIKWYTPELKPHMEALYHDWELLCEKYHCSFTNLVQAWTLSQSFQMSLLTGIRHIESLLDSIKAVDIVLEKYDIDKMRQDCDKLLAL